MSKNGTRYPCIHHMYCLQQLLQEHPQDLVLLGETAIEEQLFLARVAGQLSNIAELLRASVRVPAVKKVNNVDVDTREGL